MQIQPYLFFEGRAEEAAEFYKSRLGAEVTMLMRNKDAPEKPPPGMLPPNSENKVMHMALKIGESTLLGSDGNCSGKPQFQGCSLSLTVRDEAEASKVFAALADGGQVHMPLAKTFFSPSFGMLADKFGVGWMVYVAQ
jgi:PhnB protein